MRRRWLAVLWVAAASTHAAAGEAKGPKSAEEALRAFHVAVHREVTSRLTTLSGKAINEKLTELARTHLLPHKRLLAEEARRRLEALPAFDLRARAELRPAFPKARARLDRVPDALATRILTSDEALLLASWWDPIAAAKRYRAMAVNAALPRTQARKVFALDLVAPPIVAAAQRDAQAPLLALVTEPQVVLVALRRTEAGAYLLQRIEWLTRRAAEQEAGAPARESRPRTPTPK